MNEETKERLGFLIGEIVNGSKDAIDEIYIIMNKVMYSIAYIYLGNKEDAEDSVHDTFLKIVSKARKFTYNENAYAWINTVTKHTALNKLKKRKRRNEISLDSIKENSVEDNNDALLIKEMLKILTNREKDIIIYKYWYGLSTAEIGELLKKPKSSTFYYINSIEDKIRRYYHIKKNKFFFEIS